MTRKEILRVAEDCGKTHRWCKVNLTNKETNDKVESELSQRRIIAIGRKYATLMSNGGLVQKIEFARIQLVW